MTDASSDEPGEQVHRALGLTDDEYEAIGGILGRQPNPLELALYSVMWSEHCSYKSSRAHLGRLPTKGERVLVGPGENAGVVDVGDGLAIALRIESHNHPSAIEPYQGAATGVGGILRDIFTMGARPIALMDGLFVGPLEDAHNRFLLDGIVRGVAGYGNSVGVPTVGGQVLSDPTFLGNPLVNVFCLGVLRREDLVLAAASGVGNLVVLLGSRTGRDGIGGVSVLASSELGERAGTAKRPSVQIGDPYEEKRLIEACLELLSAHLVVGIQDLGGAGLACATSETAAKGGLGMDVDVTTVPRREPAMNGIEVMTSESQERMLAVVRPEDLRRVQGVCQRFEVEATVIGTVVDKDPDGVGRLRIRDGEAGPVLAEVPAASLAEDAPRYQRPVAAPVDLDERRRRRPVLEGEHRLEEDLLALLVDPAWIYRQYDHQLFLNTVRGPGEADATVLRLAAPGIAWTGKALALSLDANPAWCAIDPATGSAATVAESALNVACVGARPLALVNCLNFGNPEHPEVMWQLTEAIEGMSRACEALELPVVGGNVSLYNASEGRDIDPTPVVAVVGLIDELASRPPGIGWRAGDHLVVLGPPAGSLDGSRFARERLGERDGTLEPLDLSAHGRLVAVVRDLVAAEARSVPAGLVHGVHDIADGGLATSLAESAIAAGVGACVEATSLEAAFAELPPRAVVATDRPDEMLAIADTAGVRAVVIGTAGGDELVVTGLPAPLTVAIGDLTKSFEGRLPALLDSPVGH